MSSGDVARRAGQGHPRSTRVVRYLAPCVLVSGRHQCVVGGRRGWSQSGRTIGV